MDSRQIIEQVSVIKYLKKNKNLDEKLTWKKPDIETVSGNVSISALIGLLAHIIKCLTLKASKSVYNAIIQPLLPGDLSEGCGQELQGLQNRSDNPTMWFLPRYFPFIKLDLT